MAERRRDNKGHVLRTGEGQRKDGKYDYRYTDPCGKRHSVYADSLDELRKKEREIQKWIDDETGVSYEAGEITLLDLVKRYLKLKISSRYNTQQNYKTVVNDIVSRVALTKEQEEKWMNFIRNDRTYKKYYDEFVVLLGTGMRVSEFCGLTRKDIDFEKREINVDHQLIRERHKEHRNYFVEKTKTASGRRIIPMTDEVYESLQRIVKKRKRTKKTELIVDGYTGFLLLDKNGNPKVALHIENEFRWAMHKYNKKFPSDPLPHITPHVCRHTFCTKMAQMGMELKALQYLMGHSDASVTMNVYTHTNYQYAAEQLKLITQKKDEHAALITQKKDEHAAM